jgi:prefoldin beta subunit
MSVMDELKLLNDDSNIFKALGPVLVKQDLMSAKDNVAKRLEYIQQEIKRLQQQQDIIEKERDQCKAKV